MKLEVGMYAYSKKIRDFGIGKIVNITQDGQGFKGDLIDIQYKYSTHAIPNQEVIASYKIIDLIEVGDYANGYKTVGICKNRPELCVEVQSGINVNKLIYEKDIKSIVTKEMFESVNYKIGE